MEEDLACTNFSLISALVDKRTCVLVAVQCVSIDEAIREAFSTPSFRHRIEIVTGMLSMTLTRFNDPRLGTAAHLLLVMLASSSEALGKHIKMRHNASFQTNKVRK